MDFNVIPDSPRQVNSSAPQSKQPGARRPRPGAMAGLLAKEWPATYAACVSTYFARVNFVLVDADSRCDAGYMLSAVLAMARLYDERHSHRPLPREALDRAAAREIRYHWERGHTFENPKAALFKCLCNLVVERPEKFRL